jgi:prolyl-tRNA synthetase
MIMVHGDNSGLVLPPRVAPTQVVIIPIQQKKEGVLDAAKALAEQLSNFRVKVDDTDRSPGFKFSEQEMRGFPIRVEIGPKDIEAGNCVVVRRDTREKYTVAQSELKDFVAKLLDTIHNDMYEKAKKHLEENIFEAKTYDEFKDCVANKPGFVKAMWCGDVECENKIKEDTTATSRCMPFDDQTPISDKCVCCGKPAKHLVYWGKAY